MGMFDYIKCKYPLPVEGANERSFQTKDTPSQSLDHYEIKENGMLFKVKDFYKENFEPQYLDNFLGEISFHEYEDRTKLWIAFCAYFTHGILREVHLTEHNINGVQVSAQGKGEWEVAK